MFDRHDTRWWAFTLIKSNNLDYNEDSSCEVDLNVVATGKGELIEVQGTAERAHSRAQLDQMLERQLGDSPSNH